MSSSDDSFGWSAASDSIMASSEDENASQASSILDRKSHKKQLKEYVMKNELKIDEVVPEIYTEDVTSKKKKKKKDKRHKNETTEDNASYISDLVIPNIKLEPDDSLNAKPKKKKIKSEPEEFITIKTPTPEKKSNKKNKKNTELQDDHYANAQVKQEESDSSSKKKKKKKRLHSIDQEDGDIETLSQSFTGSPAKKRKGIKKSEEISVVENDSNYHPLSADDSTSGIEHGSPKKKKNMSFSELDIELSRKKNKEGTRKTRKDFNDTQNTEESNSSKCKKSFQSFSSIHSIGRDNASSATNPLHKNSIQSKGSNHKNSTSESSSVRKISTSTITSSHRRHSSSISPQRSHKRSYNSSSSQSEARRSKTPEKMQSRRRSSSSDSSSIAEPHGNKSAPVNKSVEPKNRTSLSERIRFEDDMNDSQRVSISTSSTTRLNKFLERNPKLEHIPSTEGSVDINVDDEVWILKCPKDYNHEKLKNMDISVEDKMKMKLDGQTYDGILQKETHSIAVFLPCKNKFEIRHIHPKGTLTFRKRIPKVDVNEMSFAVPAETFILLPETKRRHPLFGHDYRKFTKIPSSVAERLTETVPRKKLKSKHKYKEEKFIDTVGKDEPDSFTDEVLIKKKKKRKRKLSDSESTDTVPKKFKLDPDAKVWDSEKGIERSLFTF